MGKIDPKLYASSWQDPIDSWANQSFGKSLDILPPGQIFKKTYLL